MKRIQLISLRKLTSVLAGTMCLIVSAGNAGAQSTSAVTRVEEDWELVVISASDDLTAPQVVMEMSPDNSHSGNYFTLEINHSTMPEFSHGGIQVHAWIDDESHDFRNSPTDRTFERVRERIRWTQVLKVEDGSVQFSVPSFFSTSIGHFTNDPMLMVSMPASMSDLSGYSPQHSVEKSSVPYAENRVSSMILKRVRFYSGDTLVEDRAIELDVLAD